MAGRCRRCYTIGCTSRHREWRGKLLRFPWNPVRAKLWAQKFGRLCTKEEAGFLRNKFLCRDQFLPTDFTTPEGIRLNRLAVPCGLDLASHSIPQPFLSMLPTLSNPQISPENSNLPVLPPPPLPSELTPEENSLHGLPPLRTYSKLPLSSTHTETPLPIHIDSPSTSFQFSVPKPKPAAANIFSVQDTSLFLTFDASYGEFRCSNDKNSASKPRARHSL